ncbi:MAG: hypothetical protein E7375_01080 [Clostridiales bacterium]|nr:hypothetical protein [Clostridiales bacterium]
MNFFKKIMLVMIFLMLGMGVVVIAECFIPMAIGSENPDSETVFGINEISLAKNDFSVNEPLSVEGSKLSVDVGEGSTKIVPLQQSYVLNFSTNEVGQYKMIVSYEGFSETVDYSVGYKTVDFGNQVFDFELNQTLGKDLKIYCYDHFDKVVFVDTFENVEILDFDTSSLTEKRTAVVSYRGQELYFDYSVGYFSSVSNYVGTSAEVEDCVYEVLEFVPDTKTTLKVAKKIASLNVVEKVYEFSLTRVDALNYSMFLSGNAVAKIEYQKLTLMKGVIGNLRAIEIPINVGKAKVVDVPTIKSILTVEGFSDNFVLNQEANVQSVELVLILSNLSLIKVCAENVENFSTDKVGTFTAKFDFYSFSYYKTYSVVYKYIEILGANKVFQFKQFSDDIFELILVCYDVNDTPIAIKNVGDSDVSVQNFDSSIASNGEVKTAIVVSNGATCFINYVIV